MRQKSIGWQVLKEVVETIFLVIIFLAIFVPGAVDNLIPAMGH